MRPPESPCIIVLQENGTLLLTYGIICSTYIPWRHAYSQAKYLSSWQCRSSTCPSLVTLVQSFLSMIVISLTISWNPLAVAPSEAQLTLSLHAFLLLQWTPIGFTRPVQNFSPMNSVITWYFSKLGDSSLSNAKCYFCLSAWSTHVASLPEQRPRTYLGIRSGSRDARCRWRALSKSLSYRRWRPCNICFRSWLLLLVAFSIHMYRTKNALKCPEITKVEPCEPSYRAPWIIWSSYNESETDQWIEHSWFVWHFCQSPRVSCYLGRPAYSRGH